MKILALEFSSPQRSVAVLSHPGGIAPSLPARDKALTEQRPAGESVEVIETGRGGAGPLAMMDEVVRRAGLERGQIDRLVIGIGPGSYTGIRAAIALAQGWQLGRNVELQVISSAECLAWQAGAEGLTGRVRIVIDAQRGEFYMAEYDIGAGSCRETDPLRLVSEAEVQGREGTGGVLIGPGITRWFPSGRVLFPSAAMLARMALDRNDCIAGERIEPIYLRKIEFIKAPPPRQWPEAGGITSRF